LRIRGRLIPRSGTPPIGTVDPGFEEVDPLFAVGNDAAPSCRSAWASSGDPTARQALEARLSIHAEDDFDDAIMEGNLVHDPGAFMSDIGEQMLG